jgi:hypothetical protein
MESYDCAIVRYSRVCHVRLLSSLILREVQRHSVIVVKVGHYAADQVHELLDIPGPNKMPSLQTACANLCACINYGILRQLM